MKLTFLGAAHEVTGSATLLETGGKKILIDYGMEQGIDIYENCDLPVFPGEIDCILLTHAHIDHSGMLPALGAAGYRGPIYCTGATHRLCSIMLMDSAHIQEFEAEWRNRKAKRASGALYTPIYTIKDAEKTLNLFRSCSYGEVYNILDGVSIRFIDAGHLLGSASIEITVTEDGITKTILFSGDIGNIDRPLIRDPERPEKADYVIIESTYGNRLHGERPDYLSQLSKIIQDTLDRGGNVVIPSFAVGRTQELLYLIREIKEKGLIKNHDGFPVWVDSPLAVEATNIYSHDMMDYYDSETIELIKNGINPINFPDLHLSITSEESKAINDNNTPKVILSASGMCEAGRIRHHLKHNLWREESTILFVGYQAEGTLGRVILEGAKNVKLFKEEIQINARIEKMEGISGHGDMNQLLAWLKNLKEKPEMVFVNHGGDTVCDEFAETIKSTLHMKAEAPYNGASYDLFTGNCLQEGNRRPIEIKVKRKPSTLWEKLLQSGKRLISVIEKNKGLSNKDIARFTSQIDELCNKWDR